MYIFIFFRELKLPYPRPRVRRQIKIVWINIIEKPVVTTFWRISAILLVVPNVSIFHGIIEISVDVIYVVRGRLR